MVVVAPPVPHSIRASAEEVEEQLEHPIQAWAVEEAGHLTLALLAVEAEEKRKFPPWVYRISQWQANQVYRPWPRAVWVDPWCRTRWKRDALRSHHQVCHPHHRKILLCQSQLQTSRLIQDGRVTWGQQERDQQVWQLLVGLDGGMDLSIRRSLQEARQLQGAEPWASRFHWIEFVS